MKSRPLSIPQSVEGLRRTGIDVLSAACPMCGGDFHYYEKKDAFDCTTCHKEPGDAQEFNRWLSGESSKKVTEKASASSDGRTVSKIQAPPQDSELPKDIGGARMHQSGKAPAGTSSKGRGQMSGTSSERRSNTAQPVLKCQEILLTKVTSHHVLSKTYCLEDGHLIKKTAGEMTKGTAETVRLSSAQDFSDLLANLHINQALVYGITGHERADIVTKKQWFKLGRPNNPIARIKELFHYPAGPAVMMHDYDPSAGKDAYSKDKLTSIFREVVPGMNDATMIWWTSSSSHIHNGDEDLTGLKGQRIYNLVKEGSDIPRAAKAVDDYLWAAGYGYILIGKAGQILERCLFDTSVYQPTRLDFAAGALCKSPLTQRRGKPEIIPGQHDLVDTRELIPDPPAEILLKADTARKKAKEDAKPQADTIKNKFILTRAMDLAGDDADDTQIEQAKSTIKSAVENSVLYGDFIVHVFDGAEVRPVTVGTILDNPDLYHGIECLDPVEPDYDDHKKVGKIYIFGACPTLHSFAHGGRNFKLLRQPWKIELIQGQTHNAILQTIKVMNRSPFVYDMGDGLVQVADGRVYPLDQDSLRHILGGITQYFRQSVTKEGEIVTKLEDVPAKVCREIVSIGSRRRLKQIKAVLTVPGMRPDGSLILKPGYDEETNTLLDIKGVPHIPEHPTIDECLSALDILWKPFKEFPFVSDLDQAIWLSACLTAAIRPTIPTSPAFAIDSPIQASGKTLMAKAIAAIAADDQPSVWPHTSGRDDEEVRKRVFSALREGSRTVIWDNILGIFDSASFASALTSEFFTDRVLGRSESARVPNRAMFILTGNNLCLGGDMPRRVLKLRLDPETDKPYAREFKLDPVSYVQGHRLNMIEAALTLIRGTLTHNTTRAPGRMASFEIWDDLVRQTVCWLRKEIGDFEDPMEAINEAQTGDPEQELLFDLLECMHRTFFNLPQSTKNIIHQARHDDELAEAIKGLSGRDDLPTPKSLGRVLSYRMDRIVQGFVLKRIKYSNASKWLVKKI